MHSLFTSVFQVRHGKEIHTLIAMQRHKYYGELTLHNLRQQASRELVSDGAIFWLAKKRPEKALVEDSHPDPAKGTWLLGSWVWRYYKDFY